METENKNEEKTIEENILHQTTKKIYKCALLDILREKVENIESISTIYQKIDTQYKYKIDIIISKEEHYENI